jgi:hypothetical protein
VVTKSKQSVTYTAKAARCSEIRTKHSTQSEHHVEFLDINGLEQDQHDREADSDKALYVL